MQIIELSLWHVRLDSPALSDSQFRRETKIQNTEDKIDMISVENHDYLHSKKTWYLKIEMLKALKTYLIPSLSLLITWPRVIRLLLMAQPSLKRSPEFSDAFSDPAKSTKYCIHKWCRDEYIIIHTHKITTYLIFTSFYKFLSFYI